MLQSVNERSAEVGCRIRNMGRIWLSVMSAAIWLALSMSARADVLVLRPGMLGPEVDRLAEEGAAPVSLELRGEASAVDLASLKRIPRSVELLDLSGLRISAVDLGTASYMGRSSFAEGEIPPYSLFATGIKKVMLPDGLRAIGEGAFAQSALESVSLPASVRDIGESAFYRCTALSEADLSSCAPDSIPPLCFYGCVALRRLSLPSSVRKIGKMAFMKSGLGNLDLGQATSAGDYAFALMPALREIKCTAGLMAGEGCFFGDSRLEMFPSHPKGAGALAFAGSGARSFGGYISGEVIEEGAYAAIPADSVAFGPEVREIRSHAFRNVDRLETIDIRACADRIPRLSDNAFSGVDTEGIRLIVDDRYVDLWKSDDGWRRFDIIGRPSGIKDITAGSGDGGPEIRLDGDRLVVRASAPIESVHVYSADGLMLFMGVGEGELFEVVLPGLPPVVIVRVSSGGVIRSRVTGR